MNWRGHFIFGFLSFVVIGYFLFNFNNVDMILLSLIAGFCALLPDLDHKLSKSRAILDKAVPILSFTYVFFTTWNIYDAILITLIFSGLYFIFFTFLKPKHRGITHTLFFLIITSVMLYFLSFKISLAFFIGYLSHLVGDKYIKFL